MAQALAIDHASYPNAAYTNEHGNPKYRKLIAPKRFSPHERLVLKAEALFPGSEIISHQDSYKP